MKQQIHQIMIFYQPRDVKKKDFLSILYNKSFKKYTKPKFQSGERVRNVKNAILFRKRYKPQFTDKIFETSAISTKNCNIIRDLYQPRYVKKKRFFYQFCITNRSRNILNQNSKVVIELEMSKMPFISEKDTNHNLQTKFLKLRQYLQKTATSSEISKKRNSGKLYEK